jgi:hypothetical protein
MQDAGGLIFQDERVAEHTAVRNDVDADRHRPGPCAAAVAASTSISQLRDVATAPSSS